MMTNFFIWYVVFYKILILCKFVFGILLFGTISTGIFCLWALNDCEETGRCVKLDEEDLEERKRKGKIAKKYFQRLFLPLTILFFIFMTALPSQKEMILYGTLKSVDGYNIKNKDSMVNPEGVLKIVDQTLQKIDKFLNSSGEDK